MFVCVCLDCVGFVVLVVGGAGATCWLVWLLLFCLGLFIVGGVGGCCCLLWFV